MESTSFTPMVDWRPGNPIPFANFDNDVDEPPGDLTADDVQLIWWSVAASFSREALREQLRPVVEAHDDWGCFAFIPIAGPAGQCRYPWPVIELVHAILPRGVSIRLDADYKECGMEEGVEGTIEGGEVGSWVFEILVVQEDIWQELTWRVFEICPAELLPPELLEMRLIRDLGL
ncbi:hypothetical protein D3C81_1133980 [compost metagenome]